jgi:hypothetical protein
MVARSVLDLADYLFIGHHNFFCVRVLSNRWK